MKKVKQSIAVFFSIILLASCSYGIMPVGATSNPVGSKVGESNSTKLFALISMSKGGVAEAARNGGISKISTVDVEVIQIGIYSNIKTIVTGD